MQDSSPTSSPTLSAAAGSEDLGTSAGVALPTQLIDQMVGQQRAVDLVRMAAQQRRFLLLIGPPGTGKSLLGRAVAELLPSPPSDLVVALPNADDAMTPLIKTMARSALETQRHAAHATRRAEGQAHDFLLGAAALGVLICGFWLAWHDPQPAFYILLSVLALAWLGSQRSRQGTSKASARQPASAPKILVDPGRTPHAPFIDATGCRDGALFGDVRHDPYQSGGREAPPHLLIEAGAVHKAHGGVLYIDEIGTLSPASQRLLLTAMQERRLPITGRHGGSSGTMVRTAPVPCDFVLVAAGNTADLQRLLPALRSRFVGYGYEILVEDAMPDTPEQRLQLRRFVAQEVNKDGRIPHFAAPAIDAVIHEARRRAPRPGMLTARLRELGGLVRAAGDLAVRDGALLVTAAHVEAARRLAVTLEEQGAGAENRTLTH